MFGLFGFGDAADCGCGDVGFGADGLGEGDIDVTTEGNKNQASFMDQFT